MQPPLTVAVALPLALLFLASIVPSYGQKTAERVVTAAAGQPLTVECALRPEQRAEWRLDGGAVPADMSAGEAAGAGAGGGAALSARLRTPAARPHHAGVYTCAAGSPAVRVALAATGPGAGTDAPAPESADADADAAPADVVYYDLRGNFSLNCTGLTTDRSVQISWTKNGTALEEVSQYRDGHLILLPVDGVERVRLTLSKRSYETDFGNYTCSAGGATRAWQLRARSHAKLASDTNVVEGQKLKLSCKLVGRPYPEVKWRYSNSSEVGNDTELVAGERVAVSASEQGVAGAELVVEPARRSDAGWYRCEPAHGVPAVTQLRVKDMYAALWPFLGICAEVVVLCAIILVYERRRAKPELDDSDTDNHDQKKS